MGRYAFFSTTYEYKFWFSLQDSLDIRRFGGVPLEASGGHYRYHVWSKTDAEPIWRRLCSLVNLDAQAFKDWACEYERSLEGTESMHADFEAGLPWCPTESTSAALLCLGLSIWHQLQYTNDLYVRFE